MPPVLSDRDADGGFGNLAAPSSGQSTKKGRSNANVGSEDDKHDVNSSARSIGGAKSSTRTAGASQPAKGKGRVVEDEATDDNAEDEDDEYEVKEITGHVIARSGQARFQVVWKGYDGPSEWTWEPKENLADNASEILNEYISKIGGLEKLYEKPSKGKKRSRASTNTAASPATTAKRSRKSTDHPADRESPEETAKRIKLPTGSWENDVVDVDMFRKEDGELRVFLTWKNGSKSQHPAQQAYIRCPQRILQFYESHITFRPVT